MIPKHRPLILWTKYGHEDAVLNYGGGEKRMGRL